MEQGDVLTLDFKKGHLTDFTHLFIVSDEEYYLTHDSSEESRVFSPWFVLFKESLCYQM